MPSSVPASAESARLVNTIKRLLKAQGKTYADVARVLELSEASVKRLFTGSSNAFSLERLAQICQFLNLNFTELVRLMEESELQTNRVSRLSRAQEMELVSNTKLLLIAVCALSHWKIADIIDKYTIDETECVSLLLRLDRLGLIELLPGNRIRPKVARNFAWIKNGPIEQYFRINAQNNFLHAPFNGPNENMQFSFGMLSSASMQSLVRSMKSLEAEFIELHQRDRDLPIGERNGVSMLTALRGWEFDGFTPLRRVRPEETP